MDLKDIRRLQGQMFALQAFLSSITHTLAQTDPELFEAVITAARPVLDNMRKSWDADDPMVAGFVDTFERLLSNKGPLSRSSCFEVVKGGKG